jgi:hypothetical protein
MHALDTDDSCENCDKTHRYFTAKINILTSQLVSTERTCEMWKEKCEMLEKKIEQLENPDFDFFTVESEYSEPMELEIGAFHSYFNKLLENFPILSLFMHLATFMTHLHKLNASSTSFKWISWSYFYRSFLADMFLRARAPKTVRRTTLLLSIYFLLTNLSESSWRLLERLRIIVSKATVEKWVNMYSKFEISEELMLLFSLDNCDFFKHRTHPQINLRSTFYHIITSFLVEIPVKLDIPTVDIWQYMQKADFGHWLQEHDAEVRKWADTCYTTMANMIRPIALRFLYRGTVSNS